MDVDEDEPKEKEIRQEFMDKYESHILAPIEQFKVYKSLLKPVKVEVPKLEHRSPEASVPSGPKTLGTKTDYVPPWYKGERGAYESSIRARAGITKLPPMKR